MQKLFLTSTFSLFTALAMAQIVSTWAGSGVQGNADGPAATAQFNGPYSGAVNSAGDVFIADYYASTIKKISNGQVTTFAGMAGVSGETNGTGTAASFQNPTHIAVAPSGDLYVADTYNNLIRKITPAGVVTTFAGSSVGGYADGTGTAALFYRPRQIAIDGAGNLFVADSENYKIRKITPAGVVTTIAGSTVGHTDGTGAAAQFATVYAMVIDGAGDLYAFEDWGYLRKVTQAGVVTTIAGNGTHGYADGTGSAAQFTISTSATMWDGDIYFVDQNNHRIRKATTSGVITTIAGAGVPGDVNGSALSAQFSYPTGICADAIGNLYVADINNFKIKKIIVTPTIETSTDTVAQFIGCSNVPTQEDSFVVNGYNLTSDITALPTDGNFEISLTSGSGFTNSITIPHINGMVDSVMVYVRGSAIATPVPHNAYVMLTTNGSPIKYVTISSSVHNLLPAVVNVSNDTLSTPTSAPAYIWLDCNSGVIPGATNNLYVAPVSGDYALIVVNNNCRDTSDCVSVVLSGMQDLQNTANLAVYPNPNQGVFSVANTPVGGALRIMNTLGSVVYTQDISEPLTTISTHELPQGVYALQTQYNGQISTIKLVIHR